jgi:hypothetical protein
MTTLFVEVLPYLDTVLAVGLMIGGIFAIRTGRRNALATIQEQTITALQSQVNALTMRIVELEKERAHQDVVVGLITGALKRRGIAVTVDGDMVTLKSRDGSESTVRQPRKPPPGAKPSGTPPSAGSGA